jgi:hypothetical protein
MRSRDSRQAADAAGTRQRTDVNFRQAVARALGGQSKIARQRQLEAAAKTGPLVSRDDGLFDGLEFIEQTVKFAAIPCSAVERTLDVGRDVRIQLDAGREILAHRTQQQHPQFAARRKRIDGHAQSVQHPIRDGIVFLRTIERHLEHIFLLTYQ